MSLHELDHNHISSHMWNGFKLLREHPYTQPEGETSRTIAGAGTRVDLVWEPGDTTRYTLACELVQYPEEYEPEYLSLSDAFFKRQIKLTEGHQRTTCTLTAGHWLMDSGVWDESLTNWHSRRAFTIMWNATFGLPADPYHDRIVERLEGPPTAVSNLHIPQATSMLNQSVKMKMADYDWGPQQAYDPLVRDAHLRAIRGRQ